MCRLSPVTFYGDTIFCVTIENQPYPPAKPIVLNLGLDWQAQATKLRTNKERWGVAIIAIPSESGEQETTCIPVRKLPAFLASINPKKVKPELRERIELYQAECDDALWNYWVNGRAERAKAEPVGNPDRLPDAPITPDQQCTLQAMVKALVEKGGIYAAIWSRFNNHFRLGSYRQLPQSRMSDAVDYLMRYEVKPKAVPTAEESPDFAPVSTSLSFRADFPADMGSDRKEAMERIARDMRASFSVVRNIVRIGCHPGGYSMNRSLSEREAYRILENFHVAADESLAAAYNALEAGYRFGRLVGRG